MVPALCTLQLGKGSCRWQACLLEAMADKDMAMGGGATPLIVAADFEQLDLVRLLLEASANPDKPMRDGQGQTPLRIAAGHRQWEMAHLLLEPKADKDKAMRAALRCAARQGLREVASLAEAACATQQQPLQVAGLVLGSYRVATITGATCLHVADACCRRPKMTRTRLQKACSLSCRRLAVERS